MNPSEAVADWLSRFERACAAPSEDLGELFVEDSYWRDVLAFTWEFGTARGTPQIAARLRSRAANTDARVFGIAANRTAPRIAPRFTGQVVEGFFEFETAVGTGLGVVRLVPDGGDFDSATRFRAWTLLTTLQEIRGAGEREFSSPRAEQIGFEPESPLDNWANHRARSEAFADREPEVLVVGGGHSGLMLAAHLGQLNVDTLVVDKHDRVGDNWRLRYDSLTLHNTTPASNFPFMPFPKTYPDLLSKDQVADWLEIYTKAMDINFWTGSELVSAEFDSEAGRWRAVIRRSDGGERTLHPGHLVLATGGWGQVPTIPRLPGIEDFEGRAFHTSQFRSGADFTGQRVLVVGAATSGHDVAQQLHLHGAEVTMMQRSPVSVITMDATNALLYSAFNSETDFDEVDLISMANLVFPLVIGQMQATTRLTREYDRELHERLEAAGLRLDEGRDETGFQLKGWRSGGGYYIDVGASELIANGEIPVIQLAEVDTLVPRGLRMSDGTELDFDAVVYATGFETLKADVARMVSPEIAETIGTVYLIDDQHGTGEFQNAWVRTAQEGLWFMVGGFLHSRPYSRFLALQLKADLMGILPERASAEDEPVAALVD